MQESGVRILNREPSMCSEIYPQIVQIAQIGWEKALLTIP